MHTFDKTCKLLKKQIFRRGINYDLTNFNNFLKDINCPHLRLKNIIHIAGTNGKGSTLSFISAALSKAGFKVGTFTSPHIFDYTERIRINNKPISKTKFCSIFSELQKTNKISEKLTEFEILTAISFIYFQEKLPDYLIYETGLGGRLDATNILNPIITVITKIAKDHEEILGSTITKIALEKAGIIKKNVPIITIRQSQKVLDVIKNTAHEKNAPFLVTNPLKNIPKDYLLQGTFQKQNCALAKKCLSNLNLSPKQNKKAISGLKTAKIIGRYHKIEKNNKITIIDSAHNESGIKELIKSLRKDYPKSHFIFVLGILKRKNAKNMLKHISKIAQKIYYCDFDPENSYSFEQIKKTLSKLNYPNLEKYSKKEILTNNNEIVILTGSIFFINKVPGTYKPGTIKKNGQFKQKLARFSSLLR